MTSITDRLTAVFSWIETRHLRVGELWLHPKQVAELNDSKAIGWDRIAQASVIRMYIDSKGAYYRGVLWGARVFESGIVPENYVAAFQDGVDVKLNDKAACMPF